MVFNATFNNISVISWRSTYNSVVFNSSCGRRDRDHMVVGFISTYAINAYHH